MFPEKILGRNIFAARQSRVSIDWPLFITKPKENFIKLNMVSDLNKTNITNFKDLKAIH